MKRKVLVVDVGGTYVKLLRSSRDEREFPSGPRLKPKQLIAKLKETARRWKFDRASIGFPAPVRKGRIAKNPKHLGKGWIGFNFARGLGIQVGVVNDAALQALGSYRGGQMLFLGIGTGLGSALAWDNILMRPAISTRTHHRKLPRNSRPGAVGRKKMEARSGLCGDPVKKILRCRLCRSWRRSRAPFRSLAGRN
jgi:predicted NBD/HSP70 family sugar kinase